MKIAIVLPTYYRNDGSSFEIVKKTLESVKCQSHKDWHLFLIGDKYENKEEFKELGEYLSDKCTYLNLPTAKERDKYKDNKQALWFTGGVNANNVGVELALLCDYDYIAHLDHDDIWSENHLEVISKCIEETNSVFICTKSNYKDSMILPSVNFDSDKLYKQFYPNMAQQVHSSICVNFKKIKTRYVDFIDLKNEYYPSDGILAMNIANELKENGYLSTLINKVTVIHDKEGHTLTT